jgi:predicted nucleotidyltransferase
MSPTPSQTLNLPLTGRYIPFMRSDAPSLMPIFRSRHQADLLTWLLLHPDREFTATELSAKLDVPLTTLHREVQRLVGSGLVLDRAVGRSRLLRANKTHRAVAPLTELLTITFGPHVVVQEEFADLSNVERVLIFGSWAARYAGEAGPAPADLDVLVIGTPSREAMYDAADRAQERLGMPVNPVMRTPAQWEKADDPLVAQLRASATFTAVDTRGAAA